MSCLMILIDINYVTVAEDFVASRVTDLQKPDLYDQQKPW